MLRNIDKTSSSKTLMFPVAVAGWTIRKYSVDELENYIFKNRPEIVELAKDFVSSGISIKNLAKVIQEHRTTKDFLVSYAGTTDFISCSGMSFERYLKYLAIQVAQAKFLNANIFRVLIGDGNIEVKEILKRLNLFAEIISPIAIAIEIHGGWESKIEHIKYLVSKTDYLFVIDFENLLKAELSSEQLKDIIPEKRIAYFHTRNIHPRYIEDEKSLKEEKSWTSKNPRTPVMWEPKRLEVQTRKEMCTWE